MQIETRRTKQKKLWVADGTTKSFSTKAFTPVDLGDWTFVDEFVVTPLHFQIILRTPWMQRFGINIKFDDNKVTKNTDKC